MSIKTILKSSPVSLRVPGRVVHLDQTCFVKASCGSSHWKTVKNAFKKMIEPIYGNQNNAIGKIKEGTDRTCEVMLNYENPMGIIVYKNSLQHEYELENALELKTLFLFNPDKNSGHGFGSRLFQRIDEIAQEMGAKIIYCTASSRVKKSISCAMKNGYKIARVLEENEEKMLYLLIKEI